MPPGPLSRGQHKRVLSDSYKRFALCDSLVPQQQRQPGSVQPPRLPLHAEAVAQTTAVSDFSSDCYKGTISWGAVSVAADPLLPPETLSRGRRNRALCNSYKGLGLCDGLARMPRAPADLDATITVHSSS